jgi:hypothetical protein
MHRRLITMMSTLAASYHGAPSLVGTAERIAACMLASLNPEGTINSVNHSSPSDTAFVVEEAGCLLLAVEASGVPGFGETKKLIVVFSLENERSSLSGGVHTPSHR